MADPREGVAADGAIVTGADRSRVPAPFEPLLADAVALAGECGASLYVYGSVANGTVRPGLSDVDVLSVGLADPIGLGRSPVGPLRGIVPGRGGLRRHGRGPGRRLRRRLRLAGLPAPLLRAPGRAGPGRRLPGIPGGCQGRPGVQRRYRLALPAVAAGAGIRDGWRRPARGQGRRKTLLAVAGLVSIRDQTWTTDRARAARRWGEIEPDLAAPLGALLSWATAERRPSSEEVQLALAGDGVVAAVVDRFASLIGLWRCDPQVQ